MGPAWVGDMVMAQSLFKRLKEEDSELPIDVVAPSWSLPLLARMPEVRNGIKLPIGHGELRLSERLQLGKSLRRNKYEKAIVLPRSFKAALPPWAAKIPQRVGYRGEMRYGLLNDIRPLDKKLLSQTVQRFVALGMGKDEALPPAIHFPALRVDEINQRRLIEDLGLSLERPVVALLPGAEYGPAKQWPVDRFRDLAQKLAGEGKQCWVFGSTKEQGLGDAISMSRNEIRNLCGATSLTDVVDLLALSQAVVSNDSGLMHIAAAVGCRIVAIYGSSSPKYTPPLSDRAFVVSLGLECSPCFERECPLKHTNCLNDITVDEVKRALQC